MQADIIEEAPRVEIAPNNRGGFTMLLHGYLLSGPLPISNHATAEDARRAAEKSGYEIIEPAN